MQECWPSQGAAPSCPAAPVLLSKPQAAGEHSCISAGMGMGTGLCPAARTRHKQPSQGIPRSQDRHPSLFPLSWLHLQICLGWADPSPCAEHHSPSETTTRWPGLWCRVWGHPRSLTEWVAEGGSGQVCHGGCSIGVRRVLSACRERTAASNKQITHCNSIRLILKSSRKLKGLWIYGVPAALWKPRITQR